MDENHIVPRVIAAAVLFTIGTAIYNVSLWLAPVALFCYFAAWVCFKGTAITADKKPADADEIVFQPVPNTGYGYNPLDGERPSGDPDKLLINEGHARRTLALRCGVVLPEKLGKEVKVEYLEELERSDEKGDVSMVHKIKMPTVNKSRSFLVALAKPGVAATFFPGESLDEADSYFKRYNQIDRFLKDDLTLSLEDLRQTWIQRHIK